MKAEYLFNGISNLPQFETFAELYNSITASDFAQSYIVWLHQTIPLFEIEIREATKDELSSFYIAGPHDYTMRLQLPLHLKPAMALLGLKASLKYCFNKMHAHQIIAPLLPNHVELKSLLKKAGFDCSNSTVASPYQLYIVNRRKFFSRFFFMSHK